MKTVRGLLIYIVLGLVGAVVAVLAVSWVPETSGWNDIAVLIFGAIVTSVVIALGRRLTGWPAERRGVDGYLPIHGTGDGQCSVTVNGPRTEAMSLTDYLVDAHQVGHAVTLDALTNGALPLLIADGLSHYEATELARRLADLGASASIQGRTRA